MQGQFVKERGRLVRVFRLDAFARTGHPRSIPELHELGRNRVRVAFLVLVYLVALKLCPVAAASELPSRELQAAQKLYIAKCAKCHKFYDPHSYGAADWDLWMEKMRQKARLKPEQFKALSAYLATVRSGKGP
ncbi:MAG TPA: hypothetical protein VGK40_09865 [Verrucomicrobiae bacterium]|jgi:mono/diheme cytochrome c family protein